MADFSPEIIAAVKDVLLDAIKILGAAGIAAYATYRATRVQIDAKLVELREQNAFNARRQLFELYREQQAKEAEHMFKFSEWLGRTLGQVAGGEDDEAYLDMNHEMIRFSMGQLPLALRHTEAEMLRYRLTETEFYRKLRGYMENTLDLEHDNSARTLQKNAFALMEVVICWQVCQSLIWDAQFRQLFEPYMKA